MEDIRKQIEELKRREESLYHVFASLSKQIDDLMWYQKLGDMARIDKITFTGPPPWEPSGPTAPGP